MRTTSCLQSSSYSNTIGVCFTLTLTFIMAMASKRCVPAKGGSGHMIIKLRVVVHAPFRLTGFLHDRPRPDGVFP